MEVLSSTDLALGLVREYLSRKNAKQTLAMLSQELPAPGPMSRSGLIQQMAMAKLVRNYKDQGSPLNTLLEVLADWMSNRTRARVTPELSPKPVNADSTASFNSAQSAPAQSEAAPEVSQSENVDLDLDEVEAMLNNPQTVTASKSASATSVTPSVLSAAPVQPAIPSIAAASNSIVMKAPTSLPAVEPLRRSGPLPPLVVPKSDIAGRVQPNQSEQPVAKSEPASTPAAAVSKLDSELEQRFASMDFFIKSNSSQRAETIKQSAKPVDAAIASEIPRKAPISSWSRGEMPSDTVQNTGNVSAAVKSRAKTEEILVIEDDDDDAYSMKPSKPAAVASNAARPGWGASESTSKAISTNKTSMMVMEVDDDVAPKPVAVAPRTRMENDAPAKSQPASLPAHNKRALSTLEHGQLRNLLFGSASGRLPPSWTVQGLCFSPEGERTDELNYGLVQYKSGPCGVLAALQAFVLRDLLFFNANKASAQLLNAGSQRRHEALLRACATILARAACTEGAETPGRVMLCVPRHGGESTAADLESLDVIHFDLPQQCHSVFTDARPSTPQQEAEFLGPLIALMESHVANAWTAPRGCGSVLLLYSCLLSRGVAAVQRDRDHESLTLLAVYGYCSQEAVNLMLTGRATSNVFDGVKGDAGMQLHGCSVRAPVGFLALAEARGDLNVGDNLKTPRAPVWVVFAESHYSVLFALDAAVLSARGMFDLYYYDELANQDEQIRLSVDASKVCKRRTTDMVSYVDLCVGTRWTDAAVDWNGVQPLL